MRYQELGDSGLKMSVVGLGTWPIGGWAWGGSDDRDSIAAIQRALEGGVNLIDTAPIYGLGHAEELIGKAIKGRDRDQIVIASKCGLVWHTGGARPYAHVYGQKVYRDLSREAIRYEIEQSLRRLRVDHVDLYQTHWQESAEDVAAAMEELLRLKDEGKIRAIGASNVTPELMQEYHVWGGIDAVQLLYNMLDRGVESDCLPSCIQYNVAVLTHTTLAKGLLTGKMPPDRKFPADDLRSKKRRYTPEAIARVNEILQRFAPIRNKYGLTQPQLTIAWNLARPGVTVALVGARNESQAAEMCEAGDVELLPEELSRMDEATTELADIDKPVMMAR